MNATLSNAGKEILKELLSKCTPEQQKMFKLMYGRNEGRRSIEDTISMNINDCVDLMKDDNISHAITQCERTIEKYNND